MQLQNTGWIDSPWDVASNCNPELGSRALHPSCRELPWKVSSSLSFLSIRRHVRWLWATENVIPLINAPLLCHSRPLGQSGSPEKPLEKPLLSILNYCWKRSPELRSGCLFPNGWITTTIVQARRKTTKTGQPPTAALQVGHGRLSGWSTVSTTRYRVVDLLPADYRGSCQGLDSSSLRWQKGLINHLYN